MRKFTSKQPCLNFSHVNENKMFCLKWSVKYHNIKQFRNKFSNVKEKSINDKRACGNLYQRYWHIKYFLHITVEKRCITIKLWFLRRTQNLAWMIWRSFFITLSFRKIKNCWTPFSLCFPDVFKRTHKNEKHLPISLESSAYSRIGWFKPKFQLHWHQSACKLKRRNWYILSLDTVFYVWRGQKSDKRNYYRSRC